VSASTLSHSLCFLCDGLFSWGHFLYLLLIPVMSNRDLHFKGQMHDEEVIAFFRDHWIVLLPKIISFILFMAMIGLFFFNLQKFNLPSFDQTFFRALVILAVIGAGYMIHRFFLRVIEYFLSVTVITNYRIIHVRRTLYILNDKESIYMRRIQDIQKQQVGIFKNILSFGELVINVFGPDLITLNTVPNPEYHFRLLNRIRNQQWNKDQQQLPFRDHKGMKRDEPAPAKQPHSSS